MAKSKWEYCTDMVSNDSENPYQLWSCINTILHRRAVPSLLKQFTTFSLWGVLRLF